MNRYDTNSLIAALLDADAELDWARENAAEVEAEEAANWYYGGGRAEDYSGTWRTRERNAHVAELERKIDWLRDGLGLPPIRRR